MLPERHQNEALSNATLPAPIEKKLIGLINDNNPVAANNYQEANGAKSSGKRRETYKS